MKIILDTNIWISFLIGHQVQTVFRILTDPRFEVFVCPQLIEEIKSVADRSKILKYLKPNDLAELLSIIHAFCHNREIKRSTSFSAVRDVKDLYLLSLSETVKADYIVSGDADLTDLVSHNQTHIIKLSEFKQMLTD